MTKVSIGWASPEPGRGRWHRLADAMQGLWTLFVTFVAVLAGLTVAGVTVEDKWNLVLAIVVATVLRTSSWPVRCAGSPPAAA